MKYPLAAAATALGLALVASAVRSAGAEAAGDPPGDAICTIGGTKCSFETGGHYTDCDYAQGSSIDANTARQVCDGKFVPTTE